MKQALRFHALAAVLLAVLSLIYFLPNAFQGKSLPQPDNQKARGMQAEIKAYQDSEGKVPLWTNSAFGGMPSYQIYSGAKGNLTGPVFQVLLFGTDIMTKIWPQVLLAMLTMYLFLVVLGVDWRVGLLGAVGYGITTYNADIIEAGHTTKMIALALAPGMLTGTALAFGRYWLLGAGVLALFTAMQVYINHVQITYYTLMLFGFFVLAKGIEALWQKNWTQWGRAVVACSIAIALGFAANTSRLWPTYEYSQETIRGRSELSAKKSKGDGLDTDYLFGWSYGITESMTLLVPRFAGGGAGESYRHTRLYANVDPQYRSQISGLFYTGEQPFVGTAIYFGAVVMFLCILGAFLVPGALKYWLLGSGLFMLSLAWGKHFFLNFVWYDYLPMFKKFRAVSMALGIAQLCFAALAALGVQQLLSAGISKAQKMKALQWSGGIAGALLLAAFVLHSESGPYDSNLPPELLSLLKQDRADLLRSDVLRSFAFIAIAAALIWLYLRGTLKAALTAIALVVLALADHWPVTTRTLSWDKYQSKGAEAFAPQPEPFDLEIKKDPDLHYRVLDLSRGGITGNAITSFFHKSLSGYHAAKLQRFQEVVDTFLSANLNQSLHLVGMLNGKYLVTQEKQVMRLPEACGNAWFVQRYNIVPDADAELQALRTLNPKTEAVVQEKYAGPIQGWTPAFDSTATIRLTRYHPERMEYEYSAATDQLAVFSEIYYPPAKGWKCFLNGQPAPDFFPANYLVRAMRLPAGQNMRLEMRFEPRSFYLGETISYIASALLLLLLILALWLWQRSRPVLTTPPLADEAPPAKPASSTTPSGQSARSTTAGAKKRKR
ncbi:MAG: hypothetical protein RMJ33_05415 [Saprospiraceae bacterium]|nr:hypothetical protein [Saprospiraceae bacterium]MDW8229260.1 hypothetical protein [Saprospiraceae bacterium]